MSLREFAPATLADTLSHTVRGLQLRLEARREWQRTYDRTLRELGTYADRELVELGISHADARRIAREAADRSTAAL